MKAARLEAIGGFFVREVEKPVPGIVTVVPPVAGPAVGVI